MRWMAKPNIVTKESPDTQRMGYSLSTAKTDGEAEGYDGQVLAHSEWAMIRELRRRTAILRVVSGKVEP